MLKRYIFHYNGDMANVQEEVDEGEFTYHQHLMEEDGKVCQADLSDTTPSAIGEPCVEAYFEDGNELTVYVSELEDI